MTEMRAGAAPSLWQVRRRFSSGLALVALAGIFLYRSLWLPLSVLERYEADFRNYYDAAANLLAGLSPYAVKGFDYPPLTALIVLPVAWLPYPQARLAWFVINWLALAAAGLLLARILGGGRDVRAALLIVAALWALSGTVAENLVLGQVNPLLLFLVVLAWWGMSRAGTDLAPEHPRPKTLTPAPLPPPPHPPHRERGPGWSVFAFLPLLPVRGARRGREKRAGVMRVLGGGVTAVAIGLATALKLWPGVLLIALAAFHWRRAAAGFAAALAFIALSWLPFLALPPPHSPARADYWTGNPALLNFSLPAVALRLADPPAPGQILPLSWRNGNDPLTFKLPARLGALSAGLAAILLALGAAVLLWAARRAGGGAGAELPAMAAAVSLALLASPISWYHYQLLQLPGLALLARRWAARPARLLGLALLAAGLTWTQVAGVGRYVERYGWTDNAPPWLWLATSLVPVLALVHFALQVGEMRGLGRPFLHTPLSPDRTRIHLDPPGDSLRPPGMRSANVSRTREEDLPSRRPS